MTGAGRLGNRMKILFFDTETTGFYFKAKEPNHPDQPHCIQLAAILADLDGIEHGCFKSLLYPSEPWEISEGAQAVHRISKQACIQWGMPARSGFDTFNELVCKADLIVAHNYSFDYLIYRSMCMRYELYNVLSKRPSYCTMLKSTDVLKISKARGIGYKWPKLAELYTAATNEELLDAHDALVDVRACMAGFYWLVEKLGIPEIPSD